MKALSVWQPWASLQVEGLMDLETRPWRTAHLGPLLIHASRHGNAADVRDARLVGEHRLIGSPAAQLEVQRICDGPLPRGVLLGVVDVVDYSLARLCRSPWVTGEGPRDWCWVLGNARRFAEPIPWRGQPSLFDVPDHVVSDAIARAHA